MKGIVEVYTLNTDDESMRRKRLAMGEQNYVGECCSVEQPRYQVGNVQACTPTQRELAWRLCCVAPLGEVIVCTCRGELLGEFARRTAKVSCQSSSGAEGVRARVPDTARRIKPCTP